MTTPLVLNLFALIACGVSIKALENESNQNYYTAGVVEFRRNDFGMSSADMLADHMRAYEEIIRSAAANETDIIIFPESTLNNGFHTTYVPATSDDVIPCLQSNYKGIKFADFLIELSCISRDVRKYLVINLTEQQNCTTVISDPRPCASNGLNLYNTNVVFDRVGRVISRYRKVHVYVESSNKTLIPEYGIFETDFGVRFGHFICFDILFYTPAQELVTKYGIKDVIFTSYFASELPFLTAVQLQQSWAWGNNVNLLAAGGSYPAIGATGSGIYAGNTGSLISVMKGDNGERKLYIARVPKFQSTKRETVKKVILQTNSKRQTGLRLMKDPNIRNFNSELLDFSKQPNVSLHLCYGNFCCHFSINTTYTAPLKAYESYSYRVGVFAGKRTYEKEEWSDIKVCALYSCTSMDANSCGEIFDADKNVSTNIKFEFIEIFGNFSKDGEPLIMPNSLTDQLYSLNSDAVAWQKATAGDHYNVNFKLLVPNTRLLTFGIYSHYFERSYASIKSVSLWLIVLSFILSTHFSI